MSTSGSCKGSVSESKSSDDDVCDVNNLLQKLSTVDKDNDVSVKDNDVSVCSNCGKEGNNLKACTACKMVKYCNRECQIAHRPQHKKQCRRRAAELYDEELFKQPPPAEDCPICFVRLPTLLSGRRYYECCGKEICSGCIYAPVYDNQGNEVDNQKCAFCRTPSPTTNEEEVERYKVRTEAGDPIALYSFGGWYSEGGRGFPQDYGKALEYWHRAGELGYTEAYCNIGYTYYIGRGVEVDKKKAEHYSELAAMGGNESARHNLGIKEQQAGNIYRALKHYMIAAGCGHNSSLKKIQSLYSDEFATKEDYTKALQLYQEYLGEIKSSQRDKAAEADDGYRYY